MKPCFFRTADKFHAWLAMHHATRTELLIGFHKKESKRAGLTYQAALGEALAFGWIDGIRRSSDDASYTIRFTPRRPTSIWSAVNIKRVRELKDAGRIQPAGLAAFEKRDPKKSAIYAYERESAKTVLLDDDAMAAIKGDAIAWEFFEAQAPWYRRNSAHWIVNAKRAETRAKRLATLIECSRKGARIPPRSY
jgi:uncharacterized protein YdeI (YjbR/CyaY-like superfamily)